MDNPIRKRNKEKVIILVKISKKSESHTDVLKTLGDALTNYFIMKVFPVVIGLILYKNSATNTFS